jgi:hypothetical protein
MLIVSHGTIVCSLWVIISVVRLRLGICNRSAVATFWTGLTGCTGFFLDLSFKYHYEQVFILLIL